MDNKSSLRKDEDNIATEHKRQRELLKIYESRLNEIADLAAHVRHELNNSLTGVLGQAQLLLREDLSQTARRRAEKIEELSTRLRETARQLVHIETLRRIEESNPQTEASKSVKVITAGVDADSTH